MPRPVDVESSLKESSMYMPTIYAISEKTQGVKSTYKSAYHLIVDSINPRLSYSFAYLASNNKGWRISRRTLERARHTGRLTTINNSTLVKGEWFLDWLRNQFKGAKYETEA
jgi:hypothetical protein